MKVIIVFFNLIIAMYVLRLDFDLDRLNDDITKLNTFEINKYVDAYQFQRQYDTVEYRFDKERYLGYYCGLGCALDNIKETMDIKEIIPRLINVHKNLDLHVLNMSYSKESAFKNAYEDTIKLLKDISSLNIGDNHIWFRNTYVAIQLSAVPGIVSFSHNVPFKF